MTTNKRKNIDSTIIKGIIILVLTVFLLIPVTLVQSLIEERSENKDIVTAEISSKWGGRQTFIGPILVVPYEEFIESYVTPPGRETSVKELKVTQRTEYAYFMPDSYNVSSDVKVEERSRSIYNMLVYQSQNKISGAFSFPKPEELGIKRENVKWESAFMVMGIPHMQGIKNKIDVIVNGEKHEATSGISQTSILTSGMTVNIPLNELKDEEMSFSFDLSLNGSEQLLFSPIGKQNNIKMQSDWGVVSFIGDFFPQRDINDDGFTAEWSVFDYNRNQEQMWIGRQQVEFSEVGAQLIYPVDQYQMSYRSAKYAIMFIVLTFAIFFLVEVITRTKIHPIQYTLVSFALILFYTLLIALSEHIGFQLAYVVAAVAIVVMITLYVKTIFKKLSHTLAMGGFIAATYIYLYVILQLEDMSLLIGSIGLFIALAAIMYTSRKVNWYKDKEESNKNDFEEMQ